MKPHRILIIDDDPRYMEMLDVSLTAEGFDVHCVHDPRIVHQTALLVHPDVIVTDVAMPEIDGFTVASGLRSDPRTSDIPLIFMTAQSGSINGFSPSQKNIDYIAKPFSLPALVERIRAAASMKRDCTA